MPSTSKMVPVPSRAIIPERDLNATPILEVSHLSVHFGGLNAVEDFSISSGGRKSRSDRTKCAGKTTFLIY